MHSLASYCICNLVLLVIKYLANLQCDSQIQIGLISAKEDYSLMMFSYSLISDISHMVDITT